MSFCEIFDVVRFSTFATWGNPGSSQTKAKESALQERMRPASCGLPTMESGNRIYVGLDVSLKQTSICVVDQTGSVVREGVVDSD